MRELAVLNDCLRYSLLPPVMVLLASSFGSVQNRSDRRISRVDDIQWKYWTETGTKGRTRDGGLRFGEMERDAIGAHGMAQFLKERTVDNSDVYTSYVCDLCGLFAHKVPYKKHYICRSCQNTTKITKVIMPYAFKLFLQELRAMNILGRIRTRKSIIVPK